MNTKTQSQPGIVQKIREYRDELGIILINMTSEEQKAFSQEVISKSVYKDFFTIQTNKT